MFPLLLLRRVTHPLVRSKLSSLPLLDRRRFASLTGLSDLPKPGGKLHGFTLQRTKHVPELQLTAFDLHHDRTGAEYLHIARDDTNNVFSIGFKTNPPDNTGVPHILEHTTLCGSEKYSNSDSDEAMFAKNSLDTLSVTLSSRCYRALSRTS